jgi:hypothetical protein
MEEKTMIAKTFTRMFLSRGSTATAPQSDVKAPRRRARRTPLSSRLYDLAVAGLILLSGAVALYRLLWMGQP